MRHAGGRARQPIADQHRRLGRDQHFRQLGDRAGIRLRRHHLGEPGNAQAFAVGDRVLLQLGIEREQHRPHRRGGGDLVGAHGRFREVLERSRLVVPFEEIAHQRGRINRRVHPFGAGRALVGLHNVADHDVDRHAVAPGIVERHRGVLQADHAVAHHRHRLAFDLGVAVRHGDRDLLMRTGEDLGLGIVAVIDHGFLDAAEARRAIDRAVVHVERLEHVHHEVAAAGGLRHRVFRGRLGLGGDQPRSWHGGLEIGLGRGDLRVGGGRGQRRGADQARAFEEIATRNIRGISAFRHGAPSARLRSGRDGVGANLVAPASVESEAGFARVSRRGRTSQDGESRISRRGGPCGRPLAIVAGAHKGAPTNGGWFPTHVHHRLAADQARELAQAHEHPLAGEVLEPVLEAQHQPAALDQHGGLGQDAGGRGRDQIGDPQRRAEHAGAVQHPGRGELAQPRRELLVDQADMAEEHRQRQEGAARMVDRHEGRIGDDVERLLAAIIRMRAPADIGEQAGGVPQPALLGGLVEPGGGDEPVGPRDQLLAMGGRARAQQVELGGGGDQRILAPLLLVEQRIEQALAHAERRDHHVLGPRDPHQVLEHQRRIGEQRTPRIGHHLDLRQGLGIDPVHQAGEIERLARRDHIALHDVERIAGLPHVQPRERAPGAADGVEGAPAAVLQQLGAAERLLDDLLGLLERFLGNVLQRQAAERQRDAGLDAVVVDIGELERAAAEIADDAVRLDGSRTRPRARSARPRACRRPARSWCRRRARPRR